MARLKQGLPTLASEAALQGAESRIKRSATDFHVAAVSAADKLQQQLDEEASRLHRLCDDALRVCRTFEQVSCRFAVCFWF